MYAAAAAIVAGFLFAAGSATKQKPRNLARPSLPPEEPADEGVGEDDLALNLDHVSYVCDSSRMTRSGNRGSLVVLSNGSKLEGTRPCEAFRLTWPRFTLSAVDGGGPRKIYVNPSQVVEVMKSTFRRTNKQRPDTVIVTMGDSVVVRESVEGVRTALGRGGVSS